MEFEEKTLSSKTVFQGKIMTVNQDEVLLPNGKKAFREYIKHSGGACVLAVLDDKVLLVKQYRYPYHEEIWEVPAGKLNLGENSYDCAKRELEEEGGLKAQKLELLFEMYPSPGYTNEKISIYKAIGLEKSQMHLDDDEFLNNKWFTFSEIRKMMKNGELKDAKTLIALLTIIK